MRPHVYKTFAIILSIALVLYGSFLLADYVRNNDAARLLVEYFGYIGILIVAVVTGLNVFVPVPAAAFVPVYLSAGFSFVGIIATLSVGTIIADSIGYLIGMGGKHITQNAHPRLQQRLEALTQDHHILVLPAVFLFAAVAPVPNEIVLIPLAIAGVRYRTLFLSLLFGTIVYHLLFAYGITSIFNYFF